jgi:hypothetical protein
MALASGASVNAPPLDELEPSGVDTRMAAQVARKTPLLIDPRVTGGAWGPLGGRGGKLAPAVARLVGAGQAKGAALRARSPLPAHARDAGRRTGAHRQLAAARCAAAPLRPTAHALATRRRPLAAAAAARGPAPRRESRALARGQRAPAPLPPASPSMIARGAQDVWRSLQSTFGGGPAVLREAAPRGEVRPVEAV